jgi:ATP-dependent helicase/nuclease subunit A
MRRLVDDGRLGAGNGDVLNLDAIAWFFGTDPGRRMRARPECVRREVPFAAKVPPARYDASVRSADPRDAILLRGMVDVVLIGDEGLDILDYKTDRIAGGQVAERAETYRGQISAYAESMEEAFKRPVRAKWLVFLEPRELVHVTHG